MKTDIIAFFPYSYNSNIYHGMIQDMLSKQYCVVNYCDVKKGLVSLENIDVIYLNWIEDVMDEVDRRLLLRAEKCGIKIIWVFHNRVSHDANKEIMCRENICFLIKHIHKIVVLSHESVKYLLEYDSDLDRGGIFYLPHQNYLTAYGELEDLELKSRLPKDKFVYGCIGTLRPDKNFELVIRAFTRMPDNEKCVLLIIGEPSSEGYYATLQELSKDNENIYFVSSRIPDYMMNFYVQLMDVLVLPYDLKTSMNSGIMLLAFTNRRTVISSDISMAYEFDENMLYRYSYDDDEQHLEQLLLQMEAAYRDGRECVREKGELLYQEAKVSNAKENVARILYAIVGKSDGVVAKNKNAMIKKYEKLYKWRLKFAVLRKLLKWKLSGSAFINQLKENRMDKVAIYGYDCYGKMLYRLMKRYEAPIWGIIDCNAVRIHTDVPVYTLEKFDQSVELVIIADMEVDVEEIKRKILSLNSKCYVTGIQNI